MPVQVKLGLSAAILVAAILGWFYLHHLGPIGPQRALVFLAPFMVISMWIFPEVMRRGDNKPLERKPSGVRGG